MEEIGAVLAALPDASLVIDKTGAVVLANDRTTAVLNRSMDDIVGQPIEDFLRVAEPHRASALPEGYLQDPAPRPMGTDVDLFAQRPDGTEIPVTISLGPIERDGRTVVIVTIVDVSHEREREAELHRRTEMLAALHRATQDLLKTTDETVAAEAAVEYVNDVLGLPIAAVWLYDADTRTLEPTAWTAAAAELIGNHPTFDGDGDTLIAAAFDAGEPEYILDTHTKSNRYNQETPIRSEFIVPLGRYGVLSVGGTEPEALDAADRTVTRLWGATVTMVLVRIERERQLRQREADVAYERDRLEEFASLVSHDLRNPLNVAAGHLELLAEEIESEDIDTVRTALQRMDTLVDDLLTLARQGEAVDELEVVPLAEVVTDCWTTVDTGAATVTVRDEMTNIRADRSRLVQLLENLFRNSVEHGAPDVAIEVGAISDGFYVADNGPGIDPDRRDEVFEAGVSTNPQGTGFGLRIVSEVADAHDWTINLTEHDDGGARFEFRGVEMVD